MKATLVACSALFAGGLGVAAVVLPAEMAAAPLAVAAVGGAYALKRRLGTPWQPGQAELALDASLAEAMPEWSAGRRAALEGMVAELAGPAYAEHAVRCSALAGMLVDQLAISAEEAAHVTLAAAVHVLPVAYPASEDATVEGCAFPGSAIATAQAVLARTAPAEVAHISSEVRERWDGQGVPSRLSGEAISMGGRMLAAICAFDHSSVRGLEAGLEVIREGSGEAFDPVVAAELIHLFRQPWQQQVAA